MKKKEVVNSVGTVLIVGAVGAAIALLWAPQTGRRTRRMIRRKTEDAVASVQGVYGLVKEASGDARRQVYQLRTRLTARNPIERATG